MRELNNILNSAESFNMWDNAIVIGYRGSHAHGTFIPNSNPNGIDDTDILGIAMPPEDWFYGTREFAQFERFVGKWDVLIYDFRKTIKLLIKNNPNILQILWTPDELILKKTPEFQLLQDHRHLFSSKKIYMAFCNYALSQLYKMEHGSCGGYMGEKRKQLVAKYGYDTKNAQHMIRLLRQGIEFLNTGELIVKRPDANELKQIKMGAWKLEKLKKVAEQLQEKMNEAYEKTNLPEDCNVDEIEKLVIRIQRSYYK